MFSSAQIFFMHFDFHDFKLEAFNVTSFVDLSDIYIFHKV